MSKISIVLSVILVLSGISASNAEDSIKISSKECEKSIDDVRTHLIDKYNDTPYSEATERIHLKQLEIIDEIEEKLPSELTEWTVSHNLKMDSGEYIKCNYDDARKLYEAVYVFDQINVQEKFFDRFTKKHSSTYQHPKRTDSHIIIEGINK